MDGHGVDELFEQIRELETARRNDLDQLQRAQASLANTQLELFEAQRRLRAAQERIAELESGSPVAAPATSSRLIAAATYEPPSYDLDLGEPDIPTVEPPAYTRVKREDPVSEPVQDDRDDSELSFRERLTRAANQRHSRGN